MRSLSRRNALLGSVVAAVAPSAAIAEIDPHQAWLEEWRSVRDRYETLPDGGPDDLDGLWEKMRALTDRIFATAPKSPEGMVAQLRMFQEDAHFFSGCSVDTDTANRIVEQTIAFIGRA